MKLGMLFIGSEPIDTLGALGRAAEDAGFDALRMVEAYRSAWVPLTALAGATSRVDLGPWVLNAYARSPFMAGLTALDFNALCGGRLTLDPQEPLLVTRLEQFVNERGSSGKADR